MGKVRIYLEGGGESKYLDVLCRKVFHIFFKAAGFGKLPSVRHHGSRNATYDAFCNAILSRQHHEYPVLLVDSEDPVATESAWLHLKQRDGWKKPEGAEEDQAQLMVTCMETWIMADREAMRTFFGNCLTEGSLLTETNLESKRRFDVQDSLGRATKDCRHDRGYQKGRRSFQIIEHLNPESLKQRLPHFDRLIATLSAKL